MQSATAYKCVKSGNLLVEQFDVEIQNKLKYTQTIM